MNAHAIPDQANRTKSKITRTSRSATTSPTIPITTVTALPIIETQAGDVSAYIPTNVISITDGQIYLESALYHSGIRPAINVGLSVSRVGGAAQNKAMKKVAGTLRLDLAQYREMAAFAQFGSELDAATQAQLARGSRLTELLKQPQYQPQEVHRQIMSIFLGTEGYLDEVPLEDIETVNNDFLAFMDAGHSQVVNDLKEKPELTDEIREALKSAIDEFIKTIKKEESTPAETSS